MANHEVSWSIWEKVVIWNKSLSTVLLNSQHGRLAAVTFTLNDCYRPPRMSGVSLYAQVVTMRRWLGADDAQAGVARHTAR